MTLSLLLAVVLVCVVFLCFFHFTLFNSSAEQNNRKVNGKNTILCQQKGAGKANFTEKTQLTKKANCVCSGTILIFKSLCLWY